MSPSPSSNAAESMLKMRWILRRVILDAFLDDDALAPSVFGCVFLSASTLILLLVCVPTLAPFTRYVGRFGAGVAFAVYSHSAE